MMLLSVITPTRTPCEPVLCVLSAYLCLKVSLEGSKVSDKALFAPEIAIKLAKTTVLSFKGSFQPKNSVPQ